ncbi:hypothetical protein OF830_13985 [Bacillus paramycoides]|uniref:hypothetical protein n=1 Tax=Bacillus paramycoides TaxID=2026194 RepID=UPI0022446B48|nr:hypothetical protein [Bacillus paramycoides]MCW9132039.1 hypothetical protein [Bacillus paramycoides]
MEEAEYRQAIAKNSQGIGKALGTMGTMFQTPQMQNKEWVGKAVVALAIVKNSADNPPSVPVPAKYNEVNTIYLKSMEKYSQATETMEKGMDSMDTDQMLQASRILNEGNDYMNKVTKLTSEINKQ